jgi:hypothetical protein
MFRLVSGPAIRRWKWCQHPGKKVFFLHFKKMGSFKRIQTVHFIGPLFSAKRKLPAGCPDNPGPSGTRYDRK